MTSGIIAALVAILVYSVIEGLGNFYPAKATWLRLRRMRGRYAVRRMRERIEEASRKNPARRLAIVLLILVAIWVASASLLDKRWFEVVADAAPSLVVTLALLRIPAVLDSVAERMKQHERDAGEDPDKPLHEPGDGGPQVLAL